MLRVLRPWPLLVLPLLSACKKEGGTPGFLRIVDPVVMSSDGNTELTSSITDLWVYVNDEPVGVWQPGRRIPVLADGTTNLKVIAGVRRNGISDDRIQYPFYVTSSTSINVVPGEEQSVRPTFSYYELPPPVEDFDGNNGGSNFDFALGDTVFVPTSTDPISGGYSGLVVLDAAHPTFHAITLAEEPFLNGGNPAFLELDYRCDTRILVGVKFDLGGQTYDVPFVFLAPTGSGNELATRHAYIDLGSAWTTGGTTNRRFYLAAELENGATSGRMVMDNIRVVVNP